MTSQIISFPTARRWAQVLQAARMLNEIHGPAANEAWRSLMSGLAEELRMAGISEGEMRHQVLEFQAAVQLELRAQFENELAQLPKA
jgi:hypothetical protein